MFSPDQYELLDFGDGRRLERFGDVTLDRPAPVAEAVRKSEPGIWASAGARFDETDSGKQRADDGGRGEWRGVIPEAWTIAYDGACGRFVLELSGSPFGHLGVFPEQAGNWDWIGRQVGRLASGEVLGRPPKVLNLFAYTGGSTLAAAVTGAEVAHVDSAKNTVGRARRNAELSGLADAPIRWLVEDAMKFVKREVKRGNRYDAVILDPPSYGHGASGQVWRLSKHLPRLLELCNELTAGGPRFVLLSCHTPGFGPARLREMVQESLGEATSLSAEPMSIPMAADEGRRLSAGVAVRWSDGLS